MIEANISSFGIIGMRRSGDGGRQAGRQAREIPTLFKYAAVREGAGAGGGGGWKRFNFKQHEREFAQNATRASAIPSFFWETPVCTALPLPSLLLRDAE